MILQKKKKKNMHSIRILLERISLELESFIDIRDTASDFMIQHPIFFLF